MTNFKEQATNNSSNNSKLYQKLEEEAVANEFHQVIQKRKTLSGKSSLLSFRDQLFIVQRLPWNDKRNQNALCFGAVAGLSFFWVTGRLRASALRFFQQGGQSTTRTSPFQRTNKWKFSPNLSTPSQRAMDLALSSYIGFRTIWWSVDEMEKQRIISTLPLQSSNQGGIADAFCGVLTEEFQRQWSAAAGSSGSISMSFSGQGDSDVGTLSRRQTLKEPKREDLQILLKFIQNCETRQQLQHHEMSGLQDKVGKEDVWTEEDVVNFVRAQQDDSLFRQNAKSQQN